VARLRGTRQVERDVVGHALNGVLTRNLRADSAAGGEEPFTVTFCSTLTAEHYSGSTSLAYMRSLACRGEVSLHAFAEVLLLV
jgi:hypothetical protein